MKSDDLRPKHLVVVDRQSFVLYGLIGTKQGTLDTILALTPDPTDPIFLKRAAPLAASLLAARAGTCLCLSYSLSTPLGISSVFKEALHWLEWLQLHACCQHRLLTRFFFFCLHPYEMHRCRPKCRALQLAAVSLDFLRRRRFLSFFTSGEDDFSSVEAADSGCLPGGGSLFFGFSPVVGLIAAFDLLGPADGEEAVCRDLRVSFILPFFCLGINNHPTATHNNLSRKIMLDRTVSAK